ncbi:MAG TPA: D-lyxose/D-mannose family sugar isomerase [Bacteroidota bacterium]|nr:D-lyxose/D-mannose family sugar isomerase [Bacteroidota bacterium]
MRRSEINAIMQKAERFLLEHCFFLPPFSAWSPADWKTKGPEVQDIVEGQLGWDITDFGSTDFSRSGLFLFTIRNGRPADLKAMRGKLYAEKIMIVEPAQVTPMHFHRQKTEDIINRGGGTLVVQLHNSTPDEGLSDMPVVVTIDGIAHTIPAGGSVRLHPGESITLTPFLYHKFWAEEERVLTGEVSTVNDDASDNRFYEPVGRFPTIIEDEPPRHLLTIDYPKYIGATA